MVLCIIENVHSVAIKGLSIVSGNLWFVWFMVFNATFNNISVISWRSVVLVEETGVPGENYQPIASH
jgi:hypothetical protein